MKIGIRLITSLLILVLIIAVSGYAIIIHLEKIPISLDKTLFADLEKISYMTEISEITDRIVYYDELSYRAVTAYAEKNDTERKKLYQNANEKFTLLIEKNMNKGQTLGKNVFSRILQTKKQLSAIEAEAIALTDRKNNAEAMNLLNSSDYKEIKLELLKEIDDFHRQKVNEFTEILNGFKENLRNHYQTTKEIIKFSEYIAIMITIISLPLALLLGLYITTSISNPLYQLQEKTKSISEGDLNTLIDLKTNDEIEDLANAFNKMTQKLKSALEKEKEGIILKARAEAHQKKAEELVMLNEKLLAKEKSLQKTNLELEKSKILLAEQIETLEKTNKSLIGREVRIIELKEEIEKLNKKLQSH